MKKYLLAATLLMGTVATPANAGNDKEELQYKLHQAVLYNLRNQVKDFIGKGANVNTRDYDGCTLLHFTAKRGQREMTRLLLEADANPYIENRHKKAPISDDFVKKLVTHKALINIELISKKQFDVRLESSEAPTDFSMMPKDVRKLIAGLVATPGMPEKAAEEK